MTPQVIHLYFYTTWVIHLRSFLNQSPSGSLSVCRRLFQWLICIRKPCHERFTFLSDFSDNSNDSVTFVKESLNNFLLFVNGSSTDLLTFVNDTLTDLHLYVTSQAILTLDGHLCSSQEVKRAVYSGNCIDWRVCAEGLECVCCISAVYLHLCACYCFASTPAQQHCLIPCNVKGHVKLNTTRFVLFLWNVTDYTLVCVTVRSG